MHVVKTLRVLREATVCETQSLLLEKGGGNVARDSVGLEDNFVGRLRVFINAMNAFGDDRSSFACNAAA